MLTRRFFLTAGAGSLASLGLPLTAMASMSSDLPIRSCIDPRFEAKCDVFKGGLFVAHLNLVGLDEPFCAESKVAQYILNFEAIEPVNLPEAIYQLAHPTLGRLELFLQPCGTFSRNQHNGIQYRACMAMLR